MDSTLSDVAKNVLRTAGAEVVEVDLQGTYFSPDDICDLAKQERTETVLDATNHFAAAYRAIGHELFEELDHIPETIVCPVGSGELLIGLHQAIEKQRIQTALWGIGVEDCHTLADKLFAAWNPSAECIQKICQKQNKLSLLSAAQVEQSIRKIPNGITSEPSAAVVFSTLSTIGKASTVLINTGYGHVVSP